MGTLSSPPLPEERHEPLRERRSIAIPPETIVHVRHEDDLEPDTFGVLEMTQTSSDGTLLVRYAGVAGDILVRMQTTDVSGATLNEVGERVVHVYQSLAKYTGVPIIQKTVERMEHELRMAMPLSTANLHQSPDIHTRHDVGRILADLGIMKSHLVDGQAQALRDILRDLKNLHYCGVTYFLRGGREKIQVVESFTHFRRKLDELDDIDRAA